MITKIPPRERKDKRIKVYNETGEEINILVVIEKQAGYNDRNLKAWMPPFHNKYVEYIDGEKAKPNSCLVYADRIVVSYDSSPTVKYKRVEVNEKLKKAQENYAEYCAMSPSQQEKSYLKKIGVCEE